MTKQPTHHSRDLPLTCREFVDTRTRGIENNFSKATLHIYSRSVMFGFKAAPKPRPVVLLAGVPDPVRPVACDLRCWPAAIGLTFPQSALLLQPAQG